MELVAGKILGVSDQATYFLDNLKFNAQPSLILDILVVAILFYWVYIFLKETRAMRILYGLIFLLLIMALARLMNLVLLNWILKNLMTMLIVAIPVVFQPELRNALEKLGRSRLIGEISLGKEEANKMISEIIAAVYLMSKEKIGALIVIQRQTGLREYIDSGVTINASVSTGILLSIFYPKSPLHDGAIIIAGDRIVSARSILPVSQFNISSSMGTRHKAGIGITEVSDAVSIIVSEETGAISMSVGGKIESRISEERLKNRLASLIRQKKK